MGTPPSHNAHVRRLRSSVAGWSSGSVRRNTAFLRSVVETDLTGYGLCFTLTVRDCPDDHLQFHRARRAFVERLRRMGLLRLHWVIEWQRRGVPHLHGIAYFRKDFGGTVPQIMTGDTSYNDALVTHWLAAAAAFSPGRRGQHVAVIHDVVGWLKYLAKHASRGLSHYQRNPQNVPKGWKGKTGRVWGRIGEWPVREPIRLEIAGKTSHTLRRWVRSWRKSDARAERHPATRARRIVSARRMLSCNDRWLSAVRGISEWIPPAVLDVMLFELHRSGHSIEHG